MNKYWDCSNGYIVATKIDGLLKSMTTSFKEPTPCVELQSQIQPYEMILLE